MKNVCGFLIGFVLIGCGQAPTTASVSSSTHATSGTSGSKSVSTTTSSTSAATTTQAVVASFSIKTQNAIELVSSSGVVSAYDESNGEISFGDNNSEPKRAVITFAIGSLAGVTLKSAKLQLSYDAVGASTFFTNMGSLRVYKIAATNTLNSSTYNAAESSGIVLLSSATGLSQGSAVEVDIASVLQASINAGDSYLTLKIRTDNVSSTNNNILNFYCNYSSTILADKIPVISGEY